MSQHDEPSYKQLHQIPCGESFSAHRRNSVDNCIHGYVASIFFNGVLLYDFQRYLDTSSTCSLRRDKVLPEYTPDVQIKTQLPVSWVAFNNEGLVLAVVTSTQSQGTFVNLVHLPDLLKCGSCDLESIARPIRVCGGEQLTSDGQPGWELQDFGWSPATPTTFAIVLKNGCLRLYNASVNSSEAYSLVGQLQSSVGAKCLSWSAKGKQLSVCLNGTLSTANGVCQGPMILQVDPQLRLKRVVQLAETLTQFCVSSTVFPLDLLWVSPSCFILGVYVGGEKPSPTGLGMHTVVISAPTKSNEVTCTEVTELRAKPCSDHLQYYFRSMGSTHFMATHSAEAEEVLIYLTSSSSSTPNSAPTPIISMELPPDGSPIGLSWVFHKTNNQNNKCLPHVVIRLTNGNLSPYLVYNIPAIESLQAALPEPVNLPKPPAVSTVPAAVTVVKPDPVVSPLTNNNNNNNNSVAPTVSASVNDIFGSGFSQVLAHPCISSSTTVSASVAEAPVLPFTSLSTTPSTGVTQAALSVRPPIPSTGERVALLPKSVQIASSQFTAAIRAEAESGRIAWRELFDTLNHGPNRDSGPTGVDVIEARLCDVKKFLRTIDELMNELQSATKERKQDLINSVNYTEKVRRALRLCASGEWFPVLTNQLDPEAARLLSQVKRRARLVETGLFDLDAQLDALSAELDSRVPSKRLTVKGVDKRKSVTNQSITSVLATSERLLRNERGRVNYITECLKRLNFSNTSESFNRSDRLSASRSTPSSRPRSGTQTGTSNNVAYQSLVQRDKALYRLFANHKLTTVHAPSVCPVLNADQPSPDEQVPSPQLNSSFVPSGQTMHPQQLKLHELVNVAGKVASINSPPMKSSLVPSTVSNHSSPLGRIRVIPAPTQPTLPEVTNISPPISGSPSRALASNESASLNAPVSAESLSGLTHSIGTQPNIPANRSTVQYFPSTNVSASAPSPLFKSTTPASPPVIPTQNVPSVPTLNSVFSSPSTPIPSSTQPKLGFPVSTPSKPQTDVPHTTGATSPFSAVFTPGIFGPGSAVHGTSPSTDPASSLSVSSIFSPAMTSRTPSVVSTQAPASLFSTSAATPAQPAKPVSTPLFGTAASTTTSNTTVFSNLVGTGGTTATTAPSTNTTSFSGSLFGNQALKSTSTLFGGLSVTRSSGVGSDSVAQTTSSPFVLGTATTGGLFGSPVTTSTAFGIKTSPATPGLFGSPAAAVPAVTSTITTTVVAASLFGSNPLTASGTSVTNPTSGLFAPAPAVSSNLFGSTIVSSPATVATGGLFGSAVVSQPAATTTASGGLFGLGSNATTKPGGGLFGSMPSAVTSTAPNTMTTTGGLFGSLVTTASGGLFGSAMTSVAASPGSFSFAQSTTVGGGFGTAAPLFGSSATSTSAFGAQATTASATQPGIFGGFGSSQPVSNTGTTGLFGSSTTATQSKEVNSLFSGSSFGLGSPITSTQSSTQNIFGRTAVTGAFGSGNQGLFGSTNTQAGTGLFGNSAFGTGATAAATAPTTTNTASAGLFGSKPAGTATSPGAGLFGGLANQSGSPSSGGFGSRPVFGGSLFGSTSTGPAAFGTGGSAAFGAATGGGLFGTGSGVSAAPNPAGGTLFGGTAAAATTGGGLFAGFAPKTDGPSFGNLAMGSPQGSAAPTSPFGASPSFTQRRA